MAAPNHPRQEYLSVPEREINTCYPERPLSQEDPAKRRPSFVSVILLLGQVSLCSLTFVILLFLLVSVVNTYVLTIFWQTVLLCFLLAIAVSVQYLGFACMTWPTGTKQQVSITIIMLMMFFSFHRDYWHPESKQVVGIYVVDNPDAGVLPKSLLGFLKAVSMVVFGAITSRLIPFCDRYQTNIYIIAFEIVFLPTYVVSTQLGYINVKVISSDLANVLVASTTLFYLMREYVASLTTMTAVSSIIPAVQALADVVADTVPVVQEVRRLSMMNERRISHRSSALSNVPLHTSIPEDAISRRLSLAECTIRRASRNLGNLARSDRLELSVIDEVESCDM